MLCQIFCSLLSFPYSFPVEYVVASDKDAIIDYKTNHKPKKWEDKKECRVIFMTANRTRRRMRWFVVRNQIKKEWEKREEM